MKSAAQRRIGSTRGGALALTLIELLVVIGICGLLACLVAPMLFHARDNARTAVCASNLRAIGQALTLCMSESSATFPAAYYTFSGSDGSHDVALKQAGTPDAICRYGFSNVLICPADDSPAQVLGMDAAGKPAIVPASYAYNVALPLVYRNASRVRDPANTVAFYDGDASAVVGAWQPEIGWALPTVRSRHSERANYLFLDGRVQPLDSYPQAGMLAMSN